MRELLKFILYVWLGFIFMVWGFIPIAFNDSGASGLPLFQLLKLSLLGILPFGVFLMRLTYLICRKYAVWVRSSITTIVFIIVYVLYFNIIYQVYG